MSAPSLRWPAEPGARPKASIIDQHGNLSIAKFPKETDDYSMETWEEIAMRVAGQAGIATSQHELIEVAGKAVHAIAALRPCRRDPHSLLVSNGDGGRQRTASAEAIQRLSTLSRSMVRRERPMLMPSIGALFSTC